MGPSPRRNAIALVLGVVLGVALEPALARADMRVLASNVPEYPRDRVVKGDTIKKLAPGQWVRVLVLEDKTTRTFGTLPMSPNQSLGTRDSK